MWGIISLSKWWPIRRKVKEYTIHDDLRGLVAGWARVARQWDQSKEACDQNMAASYRDCAGDLKKVLIKWKAQDD